MIIAGVNGGGTKTEAICCDESGRIIGKGRAGPSNYHNLGLEGAARNILEAMEAAGAYDPDHVCFALAGMDTEMDKSVMHERLSKDFSNVIVDNDAFAELYAETRGKPGALAVAGTGSVVVGFGRSRRYVQGGMSWFLGDEASGYFIGKEAIKAAARTIFEGGKETTLAKGVARHLRLKSPQHLMEWAYSIKNTVETVASMSKVVADAAGRDDDVAVEILSRASGTLAAWTAYIAPKVKVKKVYAQGGLFSIPLYASNYSKLLAKRGLSYEYVKDSVSMGALCMAADKAGIKFAPPR